MAWLLVDNSNTRTKFALGDAGGLASWRAVIATASISRESLDETLRRVVFSGVMISSVVPARAAILAEYFESRCPIHFLTCASPLGMPIDYPEPSQLGADRLANVAGALGRYGTPAIVIDFGTATTFDVISGLPAYCGGVIAPGLGVVAGYLPGKTALLPAIVLEEPTSAIGKSTVHAMQVGAVLGYRGLVREIIAQLCGEIAGEVKIIATGGDAAMIARGLPEIHIVDPDITLDGLRRVAARWFS